jgi:hypothetical protein
MRLTVFRAGIAAAESTDGFNRATPTANQVFYKIVAFPAKVDFDKTHGLIAY